MYLWCSAVAIVGMALHTALKLKSLQDKARKANIEFSVRKYFVYDWLSVTISFLNVLLWLLLAEVGAKKAPNAVDFFPLVYGFVAYTGNDITSRVFSVMNKKLNTAIDHKTTVADAATGDLETPTPLPEKKA